MRRPPRAGRAAARGFVVSQAVICDEHMNEKDEDVAPGGMVSDLEPREFSAIWLFATHRPN
jgi:hypothetical protein